MNLKIKSKLFMGLGFLFLVIVVLWVVSSAYIYTLSKYADAMFKDNYKSIVSAKHMSVALDDMKDLQTAYLFSGMDINIDSSYAGLVRSFEKNLQDEEANITEAGEQETTVQLRSAFEEYTDIFNDMKTDSSNRKEIYFVRLLPTYRDVKKNITSVSEINMDAIIRKNSKLEDTSQQAYLFISIIGTLCFVLSFTLLLNLPKNIANPVRELTQGIKEIARRNYDQQLHFHSRDEFGEVAEAFNTMAIKLNEFEKSNLSQILFEKKRIEAIISTMNDAIIGVDESSRVIFANPVACDLLGIQSKDIVGQYAPDVAARNNLFQNIIRDLVDGSYKTKEFTPIKIVSAGRQSYFSKEISDVQITPTGAGDPAVIGHLIILRNITKFQELDDAKTSFIATISHELKNPIASARLNLKLLEDVRIGNLNEDQSVIVRNIREEIVRLSKITGELLDLTQVETGNILLHTQATDPKEIVDYTLQAMNYQAEQKGIKIILNMSDNLQFVNADAEKTAWVLINLVNNAIHYSGTRREVILEVIAEEKAVKFSVRDFGNGIEKQYLDKVFEKFFKVPGSIQSGTGLGLAISKDFISKQKGQIWVESKPGEGSVFSFTLPVVAA
ncbi:MAG TPA: ATP-binding protein [Bacteroidales bacterium]|nr:ATP-binding protein [Bacteroidales bacterium]